MNERKKFEHHETTGGILRGLLGKPFFQELDFRQKGAGGDPEENRGQWRYGRLTDNKISENLRGKSSDAK